MALKLVFTLDAERDIEDIAEYLAAESLRAARKIVRHIDETLAILLMHPFIGPAVRKPIRPGLRKMTVAPYVVFYKVEEGTLFVVRVLHSSQDIETRLEQSLPDDQA